MSVLLYCLAIAALISISHSAADWGYKGENGPEHWTKDYPICGRSSQSPVNIVTSQLLFKPLPSFIMQGYDTLTTNYEVTNNGHTLIMTMNGPLLSGGDLPDKYELRQLHFHWGSNDAVGAEHLVDGKSSPMEMHLVHYRVNISSPPSTDEGLAVLGIFFEATDTDNTAYNGIVDSISRVINNGAQTPVNAFPLTPLLPSNIVNYWRYAGGLTSPPCYESVIWTVFPDKVPISRNQLAKFRLLMTHNESLVDNYRPVQALNGRPVYTTDSATLLTLSSALLLFTAATMVF